MLSSRQLLLPALPLAFFVAVFGAFVRVSESGLGCPDWPGCFGQIVGAPSAATAAAFAPDAALDPKKAWIELAHRYFAAALGLLIAAAAVVAWRRGDAREWKIGATALAGLVVAQALLGMWTVTGALMPAAVVSHLLGGAALLGGLSYLLAGGRKQKQQQPQQPPRSPAAIAVAKKAVAFALAVVAAQIALGGWVSANNAGLACPSFPACGAGGDLFSLAPPVWDFRGFAPARDLGFDSQGAPITNAALATIVFFHRAGAIFAIAAVVAAAIFARRAGAGGAGAVGGLVAAQAAVGIAATVGGLPIALAVAHNALAAALVVALAAWLKRFVRDAARA